MLGGDTKPLPHLGQSLLVDVAKGHQFGLGAVEVGGNVGGLSNVTYPNHSGTELVSTHLFSSLVLKKCFDVFQGLL